MSEGEDHSSFFRSRWVTPPAGTTELASTDLAPGFRAAGAACGLKESGGTDVGIVTCDSPDVTSALLLTRNAAAAAPIRVCRDRCDQDAIRAVVVNSGNANAATGEQGYADAVGMQERCAAALGIDGSAVAVAETGTIGVPLDTGKVLAGINDAANALSDLGGQDFSEAIMTTDRGPKRCCVRIGGVTLSAQAKGAGMIEPGFATMLCFVQTDAVVPDAMSALRPAVDDSFERITVDGQMSTNDTVLLQASGVSGLELPTGLLDAVLLQLALEIVADGEGATRVGRIEVLGAAEPAEAELAARAIANSPLVKTALYGRDPNWGRIAQAAGQALAGSELEELGADHIEAAEVGSELAEVELSVDLAAGRRDGPCLLQRPDPRIHQDQRGVHDMSDRSTAEERASQAAGSVETLFEALPYIREFHGRTVVIKYGGSAMSDPAVRDEFARDVVLLKYVGLNPVIVHGGGPEISGYMERLGLEVKFVDGLRVSDAETVEIAKMVLLGKVNVDLVQRLNRQGQPAVGLSGEDGTMFEIAPVAKASEVGFVGEIESVDVDVLNHIATDFIPVIAGAGSDREGNSYNVNADSAAGKVAAALHAYKAIFLTDVEGWREDPDDPESLISLATVGEVEAALPAMSGGMRPKLAACVEAISGGVQSAHILDGRRPHSLLLELFTDAGIGTKVTP